MTFDYPGREDLQRFYRSCLEYDKNKPIIFKINRCIIPVGVLLSFGLCISDMVISMNSKTMRLDYPIAKVGIFCFFGMMILKYYAMRKTKQIRTEESTIDFRALNRYTSQHKGGGFTMGRRYSYCLSGDTIEQYKKDDKTLNGATLVLVLVVGTFMSLGITYLATKNHPEIKDAAFEMVGGGCFMLIGIFVGLGSLFRPLIKSIQYGRKVKAVCVQLIVSRDSDGERTYKPVYMAEVDGKDYVYFGEVFGNMESSSVGDVFPIYVSKKNPYRYASSQNSGNFLFGLVFTLSFGLVGTIFFILGIMNITGMI